jgi:acetyltransferase-like isoleucine patch superfamily enzyme
MRVIFHNIRGRYQKLKDKFLRKHGMIVNIPCFLYRGIKPGVNTVIYGKIKIFGGKNAIVIGRNVVLRSGILTNPLGGAERIIFNVPRGGYLYIGDNVGISNSTFVATKSIRIGDNVLIGGDCKFYDSDFHSVNYMDRMQKPDTKKKAKEIVIKDGAWIGAHSIVCKGVTIGKKSVVGAGSVVTKNIGDNELWAGNPAVFIRKINCKI